MTEQTDTVVDLEQIELTRPLLGFPEHRVFALVRLDEDGSLCHFHSLEDPDLKFLVVPAMAFYPDYAPEVDDEVAAELELSEDATTLVMLIVNAGDSLATTTVNLRGPLLINPVTRRAAQVVLEAPDLGTDAPLVVG